MQLNHYLNFQGQAEAAFNFYKSVFGGEFSSLSRYGDMPTEEGVTLSEADQNKILHISLPINEFTELMASDTNNQFCAQTNTIFTQGNNHYISINLDASEQAEAQRLFNALSVNGQIEMLLDKSFLGTLSAYFSYQFGIHWMINCQLEEN